MKNIIYGKGRNQKEIEYVFDEMKIDWYIDDILVNDDWKAVKEKLDNEELFRIIVCGENSEQKEEQLINIGLKRGREYVLSEDMYLSLNGDKYVDIMQLPKKVVLWGTGKVSHIVREKYKELDIQYYIDSNMDLDGTYIEGVEVKHPGKIENWREYYIIIAVNICDDIVSFLQEKGLEERNDYIRFSRLNGSPSELMRKVCSAEIQNYSMCMQMFRFAFVGVGGEVHLCCPHMIHNIPSGNLVDSSWEECWNSNIAKIMRLSLVNKTFCFCDMTQCGKASGNITEEELVKDYKIKPLKYPKELVLAHESSCNLKCISCRKHFKLKPTETEETVLEIVTDRLKEVVQRVETLNVSGNGDPFFSKWHRKLWMDDITESRENIQIVTNGMLFTENNWKKIEGLYKHISVDISIDAATKETYEDIRVGGKFDILLKNLHFIGELRKQGKIKEFTIRFVVQRRNYEEMPLFVELGEKINADKIYFCKISNWNMYTQEEFDKISMYDSNNNIKPELARILENPIFYKENVNLSNMR